MEGIPKEHNPEIDSKLWYLRVQELQGAELHFMVQTDIEELAETLPDSTVEWIKKQFKVPLQEREPIPLTEEAEEYLGNVAWGLENMVRDKFPDIPAKELNKIITNAIFKAVTNNGWGDMDKIKRSAKGAVRNMLGSI